MTTAPDFRSQADAVKAARIAIWGDVTFAKREFVSPKTRPEVAFYDERGLCRIVISADVNKRLVVIEFDHWGRTSSVKVVG